MSLVHEIVSMTTMYVPRMCWSNAVEALLTVDHPALLDTIYIEGWAIADGIVFEHAWLKLADGKILDLTWLDCEAQYFSGIEYSREELERLDPDFLPLAWGNLGHGMHNEAYRQAYCDAMASIRSVNE
jgi:hypothetical protein